MATVTEIKGIITNRQTTAQKDLVTGMGQNVEQPPLDPAQEGVGIGEYMARYTTDDGVDIKLSPVVVLTDLLIGDGSPTMKEIVSFIKLCEYNRLNPFLKEAYIIKWASSKQAKVFVGKDVFFKRADKYPEYDGMESGLYVVPYGAIDFIERPDSFYIFNGDDEKNDRIVGAYAKVYRKDRKYPTYCAISYGQHALYKNSDTGAWEQNKTWARMPASMASKVAKVRALREAFPNNFSGMYIAEEIMDGDDSGEEEAVAKKVPDRCPPHVATEPVLSQDYSSANVCNVVTMLSNNSGLPSHDDAVKDKTHDASRPGNGENPVAQLDKNNKCDKAEAFVTLEQRKRLGDVFNKNIDLCMKFVNEMGYKKSDQIKAVDFEKVHKAALEASKRPEYTKVSKTAV